MTERLVLSEIITATLPNNLIQLDGSPQILIKSKIWIQRIWTLGLSWDESQLPTIGPKSSMQTSRIEALEDLITVSHSV